MIRILITILLVIAMIGCNSYTDFEKEPDIKEKFKFSAVWQDIARDTLRVFDIEVKQGFDPPNIYELRDRVTNKRIEYKHPFLITDITDSTFISISGNATFESGMRYLLSPNYSRLMLINQGNLEILLDIKVDEHISNAKEINGYVYFWYRTDQENRISYSLGRVKIE